MGKISKKLIILSFVFVTILGGGIYVVYSYIQKLNIQSQRATELQFAKDSQIQVQNKPFLSKLPIFMAQYSIYYSSLNSEIDIVFAKSDQDITVLRGSYENQILTVLQNIGVDTQTQKIVWLKQQ